MERGGWGDGGGGEREEIGRGGGREGGVERKRSRRKKERENQSRFITHHGQCSLCLTHNLSASSRRTRQWVEVRQAGVHRNSRVCGHTNLTQRNPVEEARMPEVISSYDSAFHLKFTPPLLRPSLADERSTTTSLEALSYREAPMGGGGIYRRLNQTQVCTLHKSHACTVAHAHTHTHTHTHTHGNVIVKHPKKNHLKGLNNSIKYTQSSPEGGVNQHMRWVGTHPNTDLPSS